MKIKLLIPIILLLFILTGCWDNVELENRGFAISIGVDKIDKDEEGLSPYPNRYSLILALPKLSNFSSKGGGDETKVLKKNLAVTIPGGMITANENTSQDLDFSHSKVIIFGSKLLKDEKLFREALDGLERIHDINRKIIMLATDNKVEDVLSAKSGNEPLVGIFVSEFYNNNKNKNATTFRVDLEDLLKQLRDNGCAVIPKISVKEEQVILEGAAILKDFALIGWLTPSETTQMLYMGQEGRGVELVTPYNDILLKCRILEQKTNYKFSENNNKLKLTINIKIMGEIEEYILAEKEIFDNKLLKEFGKLFEKEIERDLKKTINKFQVEHKGDFLHLENYLRRKDYELWQKYSKDWQKNYENMEIEVIGNVNIKDIGITK